MKKIIYIVKTKLHYYPPCVSQIRMLKDSGYDVEVIYGTSDQNILDILSKEGIVCTKLNGISDENNNKIQRIISWVKYRFELKKVLKKRDKNIILWFGTAESILPMKGLLNHRKYISSFLELSDESMLKIKLLKKIVRKSLAWTVCEETRGYIMKYWWSETKTPFVFPNKPYNQIVTRNVEPSCEETKRIIDIIKNKKVIIYQGIIQNSEELIEFAKALNEIGKDYYLLLMGIDKYKSVDKIKQYYDKVLYFSYVPAPLHLEITSYAHIGITFYRNDSLNKAFCAPNKIYEYTGFGIPIICNNIPGLKNTVGAFKAAECCDLTCNNIINAINKIEKSYNEYEDNAHKFFQNTDNYSTLNKMLKEIEKEVKIKQ